MFPVTNCSSTTASASASISPQRLSPTVEINPQIYFKPMDRHHLLTALTLSSSLTSQFNPFAVRVAAARGLFQIPPFRLSNRYYLVRAGESEYDSLGIINTNPVAKTSIDSGLSEIGNKQILRAAFELMTMGACERGCWIWPSITQKAYQAAEIIASVNKIIRSYIVPDYSFLDARGLGTYEGRKLESISEPMDDGTPYEIVADVFDSVTQLMSILGT